MSEHIVTDRGVEVTIRVSGGEPDPTDEWGEWEAANEELLMQIGELHDRLRSAHCMAKSLAESLHGLLTNGQVLKMARLIECLKAP